MFLLFSLFGLIWTVIIGLVIGIIAKVIMPGRDGGGFIMTALLGIAGSVVGGILDDFVPWHAGGMTRFVLAIIGALLVLGVYRMVTGQRTA